MPTPAPSIAAAARDLEAGRTTSRKLAEACIARIEDKAGEGSRAFIRFDPAPARAAADALDALRKAGHVPSPYAGIPIAIKDLADIRGQRTTAGSTALGDAPVAGTDAPVVARLRAAGFLLIGRTNMTEFAYSGLGINPHYGTPASPWERAEKRVPGGSSSGSGVAVADGMAHGALGTDTGGSCRIPAAFNGIVGFKPTARRVPTQGVVPLSTSLDSIGPLAPTIACCAALDAMMAGEVAPPELSAVSVAGLRLHVPDTTVLDGLDAAVAQDFDRALAALSKAGARITRGKFRPFESIPGMLRKGGLSAAESHAWHHEMIGTRGNLYDPRVRARILQGERQSSAEYIELLTLRRRVIEEFAAALADYDAILSPTTQIVAPRIADCAGDDDYTRLNMATLRNTLMINIVDGCSIALPMHRVGAAPTSLMLSAPAMADRRLLAIAGAVEAALAGARS